jgi:hypothetical protein
MMIMSKLMFAVLLAVASGAPVLGKHRALLAKKTTKAPPSIHAKAALDAKVVMLAEMNAPNRRSKAMEKTLGLQSIHDTAKNNASSSLSTSYDAYDILKEKCIGCKLAEDSLVSQLEVVISLHTTADEKLTEYNSAKSEANDATATAATLEADRDTKCGESETTTKKAIAEQCASDDECISGDCSLPLSTTSPELLGCSAGELIGS